MKNNTGASPDVTQHSLSKLLFLLLTALLCGAMNGRSQGLLATSYACVRPLIGSHEPDAPTADGPVSTQEPRASGAPDCQPPGQFHGQKAATPDEFNVVN